MKVLIVCSKNSGKIAPFIVEQVDGLHTCGVTTDYFTIEQKGWRGYLKSRQLLIKKIKAFHPDIIHAHYGLSGLLANLQCRVPVITTYHGSDINKPKVFRLSQLVMRLSAYNLFVSQKNLDKAALKSHFKLLPCGVDLSNFKLLDRTEARRFLHLDQQVKLVLFAGAFNNEVKNAPLAQAAIQQLSQVQLLEFKGYSRSEVSYLMQAVDAVVMTSFSEGSPQFIKEAMVCGSPLVSVDVGDVKELITGVSGCYLAERTAESIAHKLRDALSFGARTQGRERIVALGLENAIVVAQLIEIYKQVLNIHINSK